MFTFGVDGSHLAWVLCIVGFVALQLFPLPCLFLAWLSYMQHESFFLLWLGYCLFLVWVAYNWLGLCLLLVWLPYIYVWLVKFTCCYGLVGFWIGCLHLAWFFFMFGWEIDYFWFGLLTFGGDIVYVACI